MTACSAFAEEWNSRPARNKHRGMRLRIIGVITPRMVTNAALAPYEAKEPEVLVKNKGYIMYLLPLFIVAMAAVMVPHADNLVFRLGLLSAVILTFGFAVIRWGRDYLVYKKRVAAIADSSEAARKIAMGVHLPCCMITLDGVVHWQNEAYERLSQGKSLPQMLPELNLRRLGATFRATVGEKQYDVNVIPASTAEDNEQLYVLYFLDKTEAIQYKKMYEAVLPTICLIQIDNYDEISETKYSRASEVIAAVEKHIFTTIKTAGGLVKRNEPGRYFAMIERAHLDEMEKRRFSLLDLARDTGAKSSVPVSLSIAVGVAGSLSEAAEYAQQAMELALGRGGDQAVVKAGTNHTFYGGKRQPVERHSKVKSRMFAKALRNLMSQCSRVLIMGHKLSDLDCMGAALGIARCARILSKRVNIVLDYPNVTIERFISDMKARPEYADLIIKPEEARSLCGADTMLVIVDTQRGPSTVEPDLIPLAGTLVIIDHHRRGMNAITGSTLSYNEPQSSSTCELVAETLQYFDADVRPSPFECGALLAGMTIDTKNFSFNTGVRTFEAASFLRRGGADTAFVKQMFQDDMTTYNNRALIVKSAEMITKNIALAICPPNMPNVELIAAQAADALTTIRGIQAAFVLGTSQGGVNISGRSLGDINVQLILETLGGGGHINIAGAQLAGVTIEQARKMVIEAVNQYSKEDNAQ